MTITQRATTRAPLPTRPLHSDFVTQVDVQIADALGEPAVIDQLRSHWSRSPVMIFRRQVLSEEEQVAFSSQFGECTVVSRKDIQSPYTPEIIYFSTLRYADGRNVGGFAGGEDVDWHSDQTFTAAPATGAMLYAVEVPRDGGDIYWSDQYGAYDRLPADIKKLIEGRTGRYSYGKRLNIMQMTELKGQIEELARKTPDVTHPVVLKNPVTGRRALYADPTTLVSIIGLTDEENARVLPVLFAAGGDPALVYRHKVLPGDLMMWDNGCTMHRRDVMRLDQPRLMKRTTFHTPPSMHCVPTGAVA